MTENGRDGIPSGERGLGRALLGLLTDGGEPDRLTETALRRAAAFDLQRIAAEHESPYLRLLVHR